MRRRRAGTFCVRLGGALAAAAAVTGALGPAMAQPGTTTGPTSPTSSTSISTTTSTSTTSTTTTRPPVGPTPTPLPAPTPAPHPGAVPAPGSVPLPVVTPPTTRPGDPPPASLTGPAVASILDALSRSGPSSTQTLLDALRPLQDFGVSATDAAVMGMGRFPLGGLAYFRDDFGEHREGPPPHPHAGTDIFAAFDTPVRAPAGGRVELSDGGLGGKGVTVVEPDGTYYYMAHLNGFAPGLASGAQVSAGQVVGFNGDSGNARGGAPHVHFEIHPGGGPAVNPKPILDRWLAEALAAVPALLAPYVQAVQQGGENSRAIVAVGLSRHMGKGMLDGPSRLLSRPAPAGGPGAAPTRGAAGALVDFVTPVLLR